MRQTELPLEELPEVSQPVGLRKGERARQDFAGERSSARLRRASSQHDDDTVTRREAQSGVP
jgi:hypothetical protein